jgi:hypothetical protein
MAGTDRAKTGPRALSPLADAGRRAASAALRPLGNVASAAVNAGESAVNASLQAELRAFERVLSGPELDRMLTAAFDNEHVQGAIKRALHSNAAKGLVDSFFESPVFDEVVDQLLARPGLWRLIDEVAASPAVTAAITQQGLGFADQVGEQVRNRSRNADDWMERAARRLTRRRERETPPGSGELVPETP